MDDKMMMDMGAEIDEIMSQFPDELESEIFGKLEEVIVYELEGARTQGVITIAVITDLIEKKEEALSEIIEIVDSIITYDGEDKTAFEEVSWERIGYRLQTVSRINDEINHYLAEDIINRNWLRTQTQSAINILGERLENLDALR